MPKELVMMKTDEEYKQLLLEIKNQIRQEFKNFENRVVKKLTLRLVFIDITFGLITIASMIYFHQNS
jgi:hypothetical protein